jgi:hypothetical protein
MKSWRIAGAKSVGARPAALDGDVPPAEHRLARAAHRRLDQLLELGPPRRVLREEAHPDPVPAPFRQLEPDGSPQELVGQLHEDAGSVAGFGIGACRPAVLHVLERREGANEGLVAAAPVEPRDERDAARVVLERRVVEAGRLHARLIGCPSPDGC